MGATFAIAAGVVSSTWLPEALANVGAHRAEARTATLLAITWATVPHGAAIGMGLSLTRAGSVIPRTVGPPAIVFTADWLWVRTPGAVPWTLWGYAASDAEGLAQLAALGGVPLVSASFAAAGCAVSDALQSIRSRARVAVQAGILAALCVQATSGLGMATWADDSTSETKFARRFLAIQPNLPRSERLRASLQEANATRLLRFTAHSLAAAEGRSATIVWPENALFLRAGGGDALRRVREAVSGWQVPMILGVSHPVNATERSPLWNSVIALGATGRPEGRIDKSLAVPVVEAEVSGWAPELANRAIGSAGESDKVRKGDAPEPIRAASGAVVMLCFEALFPQVGDARRPEDATLLLNLADDS